MAVSFRLSDGRALDEIGFAWSPLFEAVLSLVAVARPKRTPMHLPWTRRCREVLPAAMLEEIGSLWHPFGSAVPGIFEVGLTGASASFDDELAAFRELDDELVAYELSLALGGMGCGPPESHGPWLVHDAAYREEVVHAATTAHPGRATLARATFADPAGVKQQYARLLERYWQAAFGQEWERLLPRIEAEVTEGARALVTQGPAGLVEQLLPEGHWDQDTSTIVVDKSWEHTCEVAERGGLLFVPTVYGWPRVLIELNRPWPLSIIFPLRDLRQPEVPSETDHVVADGLRALGDETRLQITRMVAEQPRSTKELAELLRLSDSAISRHLKILEAADVVTKHRDGYFVLYRLRPERIGQLGAALRQALGLAGAAPQPVPALPVALARADDG